MSPSDRKRRRVAATPAACRSRARRLIVFGLVAAVLAACSATGAVNVTSTSVRTRKHVVPPPTAYQLPRGVVHPVSFARLYLPAKFATAPTTAACEADYAIACYTPAQLQTAYDLGPLLKSGDDGHGETIVIVDCFGSPTIVPDLAVFDKAFHLAPPPSLSIVTPAGPIPPWDPSGNGPMIAWATETSLDVEYAHAMAPGARIVLVETTVAETEGTAGFPQIETAEEWAIDHEDPAVISQSFGATEGTFPSDQSILALQAAYELADRKHVTVLAATGDDGSTDSSEVSGPDLFTKRAVDWPSTDPFVTAVGGTQLHLNQAGARLLPDNVWNDSNLFGMPAAGSGGTSQVFPRPGYQSSAAGIVGSHRGVPDVSLSAAQDGGALVYESFPGIEPDFYVVGGTSEATPLFAGIVAVADQAVGRHLGLLNNDLYTLAAEHAAGIVDITTGNNTVTFQQNGETVTVPGYAGTEGYDLASGLGTIDAAALVPELKALAG
jgi:subtilase family serine protease